MIILGIDPGIERVGYAILKLEKGQTSLIECGCITTSKHLPDPARLSEIKSDLDKLIKAYKPQVMGVESLFFASNAKTVMKVGQARGVIMLAGQEAKLKIIDITPLQVKISATGYGRAEKKQVQDMIMKIFKLKKIPKPDDAADAVAIAWAASSRLAQI